ncbi:hypothetical protein K1719_002172 [Acacia pycnantha]|nr:hypothetical protein K1719_002172 [Acacia pycnantha]
MEWRVTWMHVYREGNRCADSLAAFVLTLGAGHHVLAEGLWYVLRDNAAGTEAPPPPPGGILTISSHHMASEKQTLVTATVMQGEEGDRATSKVKTTELPEDVIYAIFSWLPAKSIFKFRSCSKSTCEFTKQKTFTLKQAQNLMLKDDSSFYMQGYFRKNNNIKSKTELLALPRNESSSGIPISFLLSLDDERITIIASSNGLVLCEALRESSSIKEYFICNPVTQLFSSIASPYSFIKKNQYAQVMFAFDCIHNEEYQLILFQKDFGDSYYVCKVYSPKECAWRETQKGLFLVEDNFSKLYGPPVFYKGNIHFAASLFSSKRHDTYMSSYNLESGETRTFNFPKEAGGGKLVCHDYVRIYKWGKVGSSDESICLVNFVDYCVFTLWVLTDYESSSWLRLMSLSLDEMGLEKDCIVLGFTVMNGDSLVFASERDVYRYDLTGVRETRLERIGQHRFPSQSSHIDFIPYSNTLRSCGARGGPRNFDDGGRK